jgi:hypothetical protein
MVVLIAITRAHVTPHYGPSVPQAVLIADLIDRATEFNVAYHILSRAATKRSPDWPRYFLLSHSIELALKAFLAARGKTSVELRKEFGLT